MSYLRGGGGYAASSYTIPGSATSNIAFTVRYAGGGGYTSATGSGTLSVASRQATALWVVPVTAAGGTSTYLQAVLKVASVRVTVPAGSGSLPIGVSFDGDTSYQPCTGAGTLSR